MIAIAIPLCVIGLGGGFTVPFEQRARQTGAVIGVALLDALIGGSATAARASWASVAAAIALAGASALAARIARQRRACTTAPAELRETRL